jgi:chromosome partitioning protein
MDTITLAISNHKGGVAKTTTCLSLGASLALAGYPTLVVDMDPQADLTLAAGLEADTLEANLVDLLDARINHTSPPPMAGLIRQTSVDNLHILPADQRLASSERYLFDVPAYEASLKEILLPGASDYAYILLDCPPSLSSLTLTALTAAHSVIIPVQAEYYAARRLDRLINVIDAVKQRTNAGLTWFILVTMYDQRNRICRGILEQLQQGFPDKLLETVISIDTRLRECPAVGEPITVYAPRTRATQQYHQLAQEIRQKLAH